MCARVYVALVCSVCVCVCSTYVVYVGIFMCLCTWLTGMVINDCVVIFTLF